MALASRLTSTCCSRSGSPNTATSSAVGSTSMVMLRACASGRARSSAASIVVRRSTRCAAQLDADLAHARDVEQIVEQPRHVPALPLDHGARLLPARRLAVVIAQHRRGVQQRRQRVAQLVREHGHELIAHLDGAADLDLVALALRDVARDRRDADDLVVLVEERRHGDLHVDVGAVLAHAHRLVRRVDLALVRLPDASRPTPPAARRA